MGLKIYINGDLQLIEKQEKIDGLLQVIELPHLNVAVAINGEVVPRSQWSLTSVHDGDHIEIIQAVGGG